MNLISEAYASYRLLIESIGAMVAMWEVTNGIYVHAGGRGQLMILSAKHFRPSWKR